MMLRNCAMVFLTLAMIFSFEIAGAAAGIAKIIFLSGLILGLDAFLSYLVRSNQVTSS